MFVPHYGSITEGFSLKISYYNISVIFYLLQDQSKYLRIILVFLNLKNKYYSLLTGKESNSRS